MPSAPLSPFRATARFLVLALAPLAALAPRARAQEGCRVNPATLPYSSGYAQLVVAPDLRTVYIAGQVAQDSSGAILAAGDFRRQAELAFTNVKHALDAVGAGFAHVMKWNYYVTDATQVPVVRDVRDKLLGGIAPPASTLVEVKGLFRPELMIEIEAIAYAPRPLDCAALKRLERPSRR